MSAPTRIEELKKRYEENPRRFFAPLANEYRKSGDLEQAIMICESHLTEQQGTLNGHVVYGQALYDAGRLGEARKTFVTALTFDPENLISLRHLGDIARSEGDAAEARKWYTRVLDADPRNHEIIAFLAELPSSPMPASRPVANSRLTTPTAPIPTSVVPVASHADIPAEARVITPTVNRATGPATAEPTDHGSTASTADGPNRAVTNPASTDPIAASPRVMSNDGPPSAPALPAPEPEHELMDLTIDLAPKPSVPWQSGATDTLFDTDILFSEGHPETVHSSVPPAAERSADMMFGDTLPFSEEPEPLVEPGTDSYLGRTPSLGTEVVNKSSEMRMPFVTETMAELYLHQGFRDEGIAVYKQLLEQNPGDNSLKERVKALTAGARSSLALNVGGDRAADTGPVLTDAADAPSEGGRRESDATPGHAVQAAPAAPAASLGSWEASAPSEPLALTNAVAASEAVLPVDPTRSPGDTSLAPRPHHAPVEPEELPVPPASAPRVESAPSGNRAVSGGAPAAHLQTRSVSIAPPTPPFSAPRTVREVFGALAARRAVRPEVAEHVSAEASASLPVRSATPAASAAPVAAPQNSVGALFNASAVNVPDERAATVLARASEGLATSSGTRARPTPASGSLFLDDVFSEPPERATAVETHELPNLSFDEFFATPHAKEDAPARDISGGESSPTLAASAWSSSQGGPETTAGDSGDSWSAGEESAPPPASEGRSPEELEQFQDWLQQLKKP